MSLLRSLSQAYRSARLLIANRQRCRALAAPLTSEARDSSLLVLTESAGGVDVRLVELAGYLNRTARCMAPEQLEQFIDAAAVKTDVGEMRAFVVMREGSGRFFSIEVSP
jgi:hypothetical protein